MRGNRLVAVAATILSTAGLGVLGLSGPARSAPSSVTASTLTFTGTWDGSPSASEYWTQSAGATVTATVDVGAGGGTVSLVGDVGSGSGIVTVSVDGAPATTVDLYRPGFAGHVAWYTSPALAQGRHTVRVTVTGTHRPEAAGAWVDVMGASTTNGTVVVAAPAGWSLTTHDDFTGTALDDTTWYVYDGVSSSGSQSPFRPDHVSVHDGYLDIDNYRDGAYGWAGGGLATRGEQTYGKYEVRMRVDAAQGIGTAILLWPADDSWPPEVDFVEHNGVVPRALNTATLHCGTPENHLMEQRSVATDLSQWHTWGVEWTPGRLVHTVDGAPWATVTNDCVPDIDMEFGLQTEIWRASNGWTQVPDATTPAHSHLQVDWVRVYAPV